MTEIEHQGTVAMSTPEPISRDLLGKIVDEVFDGAIEDASVIEAIYAAIKKHETPPPQDHVLGLEREIASLQYRLEEAERHLSRLTDGSWGSE